MTFCQFREFTNARRHDSRYSSLSVIICILQQLECTAVATREMLYASVLFMTQTRFCSPFDVSSQRHSFCA